LAASMATPTVLHSAADREKEPLNCCWATRACRACSYKAKSESEMQRNEHVHMRAYRGQLGWRSCFSGINGNA
jgi:hypothetical protein